MPYVNWDEGYLCLFTRHGYLYKIVINAGKQFTPTVMIYFTNVTITFYTFLQKYYYISIIGNIFEEMYNNGVFL